MFFHLTSTFESILSSETSVDLNGMTAKLKKQEKEIENLLSQIAYEYMETIQYFSSPELKLAMIVLMAGMSTYSRNSCKKKMLAECKDDPVKIQQIEKLFSDE